MKSVYRHIIISALFVTFISTTVLGVAADFSISKKVKGYNTNISIAVNTSNNSVLVTWKKVNLGSGVREISSKIYAALCKKKKNGKYKAGKARLVADDETKKSAQSVAYNPDDNSYIVVWSQDTTPQYPGDHVWAQKVTAKGKMEGDRIAVTPTASTNQEPIVHYMPSSFAGPAVSSGGYLLVWSRYIYPTPSDGGLWSRILDHNGNPTSAEPALLARRWSSPPAGYKVSYQTDITRTPQGFFLLGGNVSGTNAYLIKLDSSGKFIKERNLQNGSSLVVRVLGISRKVNLASWTTDGDMLMQRFNAKLKPTGNAINPLSLKVLLLTGFVKLEDNSGAYQVSASQGRLWGRHINNAGQLDTVEKSHTKAYGSMFTFDIGLLPGTNNIFVAFGFDKAGGNNFIVGSVFKAD